MDVIVEWLLVVVLLGSYYIYCKLNYCNLIEQRHKPEIRLKLVVSTCNVRVRPKKKMLNRRITIHCLILVPWLVSPRL